MYLGFIVAQQCYNVYIDLVSASLQDYQAIEQNAWKRPSLLVQRVVSEFQIEERKHGEE